MLKKKRVLFIIALCLVLTVPVLADDNKSINEMATSLNNINILKGDGTDYNLSGQLKRSEAAAFIVRLLGVEKEVKANIEKYSNTVFNDVSKSKWYAPYIGYVAVQGIVAGFDDGNFKPDEFVSEKAFTKMVLGALGYYQSQDFAWNEIYKFGYSKGLFIDSSYEAKLSDNMVYTRGDVVNLLYQSLDKEIKDKDITIIQRLVNSAFITENEAMETGLYEADKIKTNIESIDVISNTKIKIKLTEEIKDLDESNISIIERDKDKELKVKKVTLNKKEITVTTDEQEGNKVYDIKLTNLVDKEGFTVSEVSNEFKGYYVEVIESNFFKISKVEAVSKNIVNIYFTHPIDQSAAIPLNFDIKKEGGSFVEGSFSSISAKVLGNENNAVSLFIKDKDLNEGVKYSVVVDADVTSIYGVKLNDGDGEEFEFAGNHENNEPLHIVNVEPVEKDYIMITFNKDIDSSSATVSSNYELEDTDNGRVMSSALGAVLAGEGADKYRMVKVRFISMVKDHNYIIKIKNVKDAYRQSYISEEAAPFYGYRDSEASLKVDYAYPENENTIKVYFNKNVSSNIVNATFVMNGVSFVAKQFREDEPRVLTLFTSSSTPLQSGTEYKLSIIGAKNEFAVPYTQPIEYTFTGDAAEFGEIGVVECKFIANDTILVRFNKDIDNASNNASKFKVEYSESNSTKTITASYINYVNSKTVAVKFSSIDMNRQYNLKISNLVNYSNQFTTREVSSSIQQ